MYERDRHVLLKMLIKSAEYKKTKNKIFKRISRNAYLYKSILKKIMTTFASIYRFL